MSPSISLGAVRKLTPMLTPTLLATPLFGQAASLPGSLSMPVPPSQTWRGSWPPSEVRLRPVLSTDGSAAVDKDSPLSYFLSPPMMVEEDDETTYFTDDYDGDESDDFTEFELDAGIEDVTHPLPIVRSVSPSSLADLNLPRPRPPTPPRSYFAGAAAADDDDDAEPVFNFQLDARDEMTAPAPAILDADADDSDSWTPSTRLLFPVLRPATAKASRHLPALVGSPPTSARGRSASRHDLPASSVADWKGIPIAGRRPPLPPRSARSPRSPRSWRVPSPDVFSIEEETEQQLVDSGLLDFAHRPVGSVGSTALKPKKHVRFVLPDEEVV
ncbi:hypothetical protein CMQ_6227 [Grosmannia clavigera kw1407]|uniref:Uncharacterized protein n=1 Tax=Grosmannia clavigera (strain kw1407 / UAMH 11150) TaxID=655863 RepID=F0XME3_GROCL|nr:uncharacterized protein CMQ_6227 [Grosmannia clavigera kw1407]EFX01285.1 hypothetical protein CMQ_6227 [Grosmannia clavigera kw1407]